MTPEQILQDFIKDRNKSPEHTQELIKGYAQVIRDWCGGVIGEDEIRPTSWANRQTLELEWRSRQVRNHYRAKQRERAGIKG